MSNPKIDKEITALLVIDPYNDFISEGGKFWDHMRHVAEANNCVPNMLQVLNAARKAEPRVFYALHRQYRPGDYETWKYIAPVRKAAWLHKAFEHGTWGVGVGWHGGQDNTCRECRRCDARIISIAGPSPSEGMSYGTPDFLSHDTDRRALYPL